MVSQLIKGGVVGGVVVFLWSIISWMVLPFHAKTLNTFSNEILVEQALLTSASSGSGIYILPNTPDGLTGEAKKTARMNAHKKMETGPLAFVSFRKEGIGSMGILMLKSLFIQSAGGILICLMLILAKLESYQAKIGYVFLFSLTASILCFIPSWNWWGYSLSYVLLESADLMIGWFLAGLVIAKIIK